LFLLPALLSLVVLRLYPAIIAIVNGFRHAALGAPGAHWAGLQNYRWLFSDPGFLHSLWVTVLFNLLINPNQVVIALGLAVLLTQRILLAGLWRTLVFLPIAVPAAASAIVWNVIFQPDGLADGFLGVFGVGAQPFLTSAHQAMWCVIVVCSWIGVGYWMMFLIAGLQDIPRVYYEAAVVDGAGVVKRFWHVTLPLLRRPLAFVLVADTVANFVTFAPVQILTSGGPEKSTNLLMYEIYRQAYQIGDLHYADAEVTILIVILTVITAIEFKLLQSRG